VSTRSYRALLTHGTTTDDSLISIFLELACQHYNNTYLSTYFITVLRRDKSWTRVAYWFAYSCTDCSHSKPHLHHEPATMSETPTGSASSAK